MRNISSLIFFLVLFNFHSIFAGNENYPVGARSAAMGNATVMMSDLWSIHHNQAGLASIENISVGFHFENKKKAKPKGKTGREFPLNLAMISRVCPDEKSLTFLLRPVILNSLKILYDI